MAALGTVAGTLGLLATLWITGRARTRLRGTTLTSAGNWAGAGVLTWTAAWGGSWILQPALADQLWYAATLLLIGAAVAVLGARRPGTRVWSGFVVVPLLCVLGWPALFVWQRSLQPDRLILLEPAFVAVAFVAVMGLGNYLGTRFASSAVLVLAALFLVLAPMAALHWSWLPGIEVGRTFATLLLSAAAGLAAIPRPDSAGEPLDRVWHDFRDAFGLVWSQRLQVRFNEMARHAPWPLRLEVGGFVAHRDFAGQHPEAAGHGQILPADWAAAESGLRWLLRRFVDPEWIDRRLHRAATMNDPGASPSG